MIQFILSHLIYIQIYKHKHVNTWPTEGNQRSHRLIELVPHKKNRQQTCSTVYTYWNLTRNTRMESMSINIYYTSSSYTQIFSETSQNSRTPDIGSGVQWCVMAVVPVASGSEFLGASYIYPTGSCHEGQQHHVSHIQYSAENTLTRKFTLIQVYKFIGQITMIVYS